MTRRRKDFLPPPQYICHLIAANPLEITIADDRPRGAFWNECPQFIFFFVGTHSKTHLGFQRDGKFLWLWVSNRGESALLAEDSKGDRVPLAVVPKGGGAALAGGIQWRVAPLSGRKNPMKPAVSWHTTLHAKSSVLYLWRPWVAERGCSGQEQALSVSHRTGGFCVLPDEKPRSLLKAESACSGVGGVAEWREFQKKFLERSSITGGAKGISSPPQRRYSRTLLLK